MSINLTPLENIHRLLFEIPLVPVQGRRFQPTGFPGLGAATFQTSQGTSLLVESAQSMANRLELACWDESTKDLKPELIGLSHVRVTRKDQFLTDTILEAHRINSPYLLESSDKTFLDMVKNALGVQDVGPIDRLKLANVLLKFDIGSLIHGAFLSKLEGGRMRVPRALSAFIEADGVRVAPSGGVKNDHLHPGKVKGDSKSSFGNIPFSRDEFTAERIVLYVNIDLAQIRGYGLGKNVEHLLILLSLYKLRALMEQSLRLRTACDLRPDVGTVEATFPKGFLLPALPELSSELKATIAACRDRMQLTEVKFENKLTNAKDSDIGDSDSVSDDLESEE